MKVVVDGVALARGDELAISWRDRLRLDGGLP